MQTIRQALLPLLLKRKTDGLSHRFHRAISEFYLSFPYFHLQKYATGRQTENWHAEHTLFYKTVATQFVGHLLQLGIPLGAEAGYQGGLQKLIDGQS